MLAPGYYASQDIRTPVRIAIVVLVATQLMNIAFVPWLAHAGLALSIGLGALVNAGWLLIGLIRRGSFAPRPGWTRLGLQVALASALLTAFLWWGSGHFDWLALQAHGLRRAALLALLLLGAALIYFCTLMATGVRLRQLRR